MIIIIIIIILNFKNAKIYFLGKLREVDANIEIGCNVEC